MNILNLNRSNEMSIYFRRIEIFLGHEILKFMWQSEKGKRDRQNPVQVQAGTSNTSSRSSSAFAARHSSSTCMKIEQDALTYPL